MKKHKGLLICVGIIVLFVVGAMAHVMGLHYTFTVVDGDTHYETTCRFGKKFPGEVIVYTQDGGVKRYADGYRVTEKLTGVIINPPSALNSDVYAMALDKLQAGKRVMIVYLDGLGYQTYCYLKEQGLVPHLAALQQGVAAAMYPTITPVNYAAMVSGKAPAANGVTMRGIHQLQCETIFDRAKEMGLKAYIAEGDTQILQFGISQELNADMDLDGDTDTEVLQSAYAGMDSDLLFVHLHGIDDSGHKYGPRSAETIAKIQQTDAWMGELLAAWDGSVIVVADHGQHGNDGTGDSFYADKQGVHGAFAPSDLFVPLLCRE